MRAGLLWTHLAAAAVMLTTVGLLLAGPTAAGAATAFAGSTPQRSADELASAGGANTLAVGGLGPNVLRGSNSIPSVLSVSPDSGSTSGGTVVTLIGTDFTNATKLTIAGEQVVFTTVNDTTIVFATPAASSAGAVDVVVDTPDGEVTDTDGFTYAVTPGVPPTVRRCPRQAGWWPAASL
jgi:hypothetical protein